MLLHLPSKANRRIFRPHRTHSEKAQSTAVVGVAWFDCVSVCVGHTGECSKTAEPIEMGEGDIHVYSCVPKQPCIRRGAHWRHLANMTEPFVRSVDTVLCQITLITFYYH